MKKRCLLVLALVLLAACSQKKRTDELDCTPGPLGLLASCAFAEAAPQPRSATQYYCISNPACPVADDFCQGSYLLYGDTCALSDCTETPESKPGIQLCTTNKQPTNTKQFTLKTTSDSSVFHRP